MIKYLNALLLIVILLNGCANLPRANVEINVTAETLECIANDVENNTMNECTKAFLKACEPIIR